jgi:hypothetical protein
VHSTSDARGNVGDPEEPCEVEKEEYNSACVGWVYSPRPFDLDSVHIPVAYKSSLGWFKPWVFLREVFLNRLNGV